MIQRKSLKSQLKSKNVALKSLKKIIKDQKEIIELKNEELTLKDRKIEELNEKLKLFTDDTEEVERVSQVEEVLANPGLRAIPEKIFGYLDIKSLANCREVSKTCQNLIDNKKLLKNY